MNAQDQSSAADLGAQRRQPARANGARRVGAQTECRVASPFPIRRRLLSGWGRTAPSVASLARPEDAGELARLLESGQTGIIARGLGRSYGDAAQCAGGVVVNTSAIDSIGPMDPNTGEVEVGGGASIDNLVRWSLPRGWFVPVTPGTRHVSIGGAIAADVHGKNHHRDGSFCAHVSELTLVTPTGTRVVSPDIDPELFWATAGGMGLTGVIVGATLRMIRVETSWMCVDTQRFTDLDGLMAVMEATDDGFRYSVAWLDCTSHRHGFGRSVLTRGDHAPRRALGPAQRDVAVTPIRDPRARMPAPGPPGLVNPYTIRAFNELWFRKAPRHESGALQPLSSFFYPLDGLADWNLLYGRGGLVQYQFAVGDDKAESVRRAVAITSASRVAPSLAVLKRFGPANPGPLSFPARGWTLALDFAVGPSGLPSLLDQLDELVTEAGGRVYLAKDARLRPELVPLMYPRAGEMARTRRRVDPEGVLRSDLSRRLGIGGSAPDE